MRKFLFACGIAAIAVTAYGADTASPTIGKEVDSEIRSIEREAVSLAEAMPAEMYDFAPTAGEFKNARTFGQQMTHIAAVMYTVSSVALGEKNPSETGQNENGPANIKGKDAVVKYLKDAFAYAHRAAAKLTSANAMDQLQSPWGSNKVTRYSMVSLVVWHSFDHYGQSVVYARMNGIVPPASRGQ